MLHALIAITILTGTCAPQEPNTTPPQVAETSSAPAETEDPEDQETDEETGPSVEIPQGRKGHLWDHCRSDADCEEGLVCSFDPTVEHPIGDCLPAKCILDNPC